MINPRDLYTSHTELQLGPSDAPFGTTFIDYEVQRSPDLRNLAQAQSGALTAYRVLCTQRIVIPNGQNYSPGGSNPKSFATYPAILSTAVTLNTASAENVSYSPKTVNTSVTTSHSSSDSANSTATMQHTTGSSTSQSNTFNASASLGFQGENPTGDLSFGYAHTTTTDRSRSKLTGSDVSSGSESGGSDTMAAKDWACFSWLTGDSKGLTVTWMWGQEYPWNVILYRGDGDGTLPAFVSKLLVDDGQLMPPSQLSQFGLDFTMKSCWLVYSTDSVSLTHSMNYYTATHSLSTSALDGDAADDTSTVKAVINKPTPWKPSTPIGPLDLCLYGLDPLAASGASSSAIIGFVPRQFITQPAPGPTPTGFKILASTNNLLVQDTTMYPLKNFDANAGFTAAETALTASFTPTCQSLSMQLQFKLLDVVGGYRLLVKHWTVGPQAVQLTITVNGDTGNALEKYVDAEEAEGGEGNLLSISLRNLSYGSVDYHDYLGLGLNTIDIAIKPVSDTPVTCQYQIRAVSIERG